MKNQIPSDKFLRKASEAEDIFGSFSVGGLACDLGWPLFVELKTRSIFRVRAKNLTSNALALLVLVCVERHESIEILIEPDLLISSVYTT